MTISGYDCWKRKGLSRRRKLENAGAETTSLGSDVNNACFIKAWHYSTLNLQDQDEVRHFCSHKRQDETRLKKFKTRQGKVRLEEHKTK